MTLPEKSASDDWSGIGASILGAGSDWPASEPMSELELEEFSKVASCFMTCLGRTCARRVDEIAEEVLKNPASQKGSE